MSKFKKIPVDQFIYRLVPGTFIGLCPEGMECRHLDGDGANNNLSNLQWGTHAENIKDSQRQGRFAGINRGIKNGQAKLTEQDVLGIRKLWWDTLYSQQKIADIYDVSQNLVSKIIRREKWKHI